MTPSTSSHMGPAPNSDSCLPASRPSSHTFASSFFLISLSRSHLDQVPLHTGSPGPRSSYRGSPLLPSLLLEVEVGTPGRQGGDPVSKVECRQKAGPRVCCESSSSCSLASCVLLKGEAEAGRTPAPRIRWSDEGDLATRSSPPVIQSLSKPARGSRHCLGTGGTKVNKPSSVPWATTGREDHTVILLHACLFGAPEVLSGAPARGGSALWWQSRTLRGPPSPA